MKLRRLTRSPRRDGPGLRSLAGLAVLGVVALLATACSGDAPDQDLGGTPHKGGTLTILGSAAARGGELKHLDPDRSYEQASATIMPLIFRTLTTYAPTNGTNQAVVGDLATDAGQPSSDGSTWTFHLRDGITYQDGTPITAQDIKYSVERSFEPDLTGAPPYAATWLVGGANYKGPASGQSLDSIATPDAKTIVFHLTRPVADFNYFTTFPMFTGVPKSADTGVTYENHPVASGPYQVAAYSPGKALKLVRNTSWQTSSDPLRKAYPDQIDYQFGLSQSVINQRLITDQGADQSAIELKTTVDPAHIAQVLNDPRVKSRSYSTPPTGGLEYLSLNNATAPFNNPQVRQAMQYAVDKQAVLTAAGGASSGSLTTTLLSSGMPGYQKFDLYPAPATGDLNKAKELLAQAGVSTLDVTMDVESDNPTNVAMAEAVQNALGKVGVHVTLHSIPTAIFNSTVSNPSTAPQLAISGWGSDWPFPSGFLVPLFDGRKITPETNYDVSMFNNAAVNAEIDEIANIGSPETAAARYGDLDKQIMQLSPVVPLYQRQFLYVTGSKVHGTFVMGGALSLLGIWVAN